MAKLNDKQKVLAIIGGTLLLAGIAAGGIWWAQGLVDEQQEEITGKKSQIAAAQNKIDKIPVVEREVIILRENLDEYVKILPNARDLNAFVKEMTKFERQSGLQATEFTPGRLSQSKDATKFSKVKYSYKGTATLWQLLRFMNFIENYERFVKVTGLSVTSKKSGGNAASVQQNAGAPQEAVHDFALDVETYVYNASNSGKDVVIPNYSNKRDALREEIFKRLQAIKIERYEFKGPLGRRDVFVDPRQVYGANPNGAIPVAQQRELIEKFGGEVARLEELFQRSQSDDVTVFEQYSLRRAVREGIDDMAVKVQEVSEQGMIAWLPLRTVWSSQVTQRLDNLKISYERLAEGKGPEDQWLNEEQFETLIQTMGNDLIAGNLSEAKIRFENVREKVEVPSGNPRYDLAIRAKSLYFRAITALEFSNLDLTIQGVLVNEDEQKSGVLINGEVFEEGDYIEDNLFVKIVEPERIHFVFKGFTLIKTR